MDRCWNESNGSDANNYGNKVSGIVQKIIRRCGSGFGGGKRKHRFIKGYMMRNDDFIGVKIKPTYVSPQLLPSSFGESNMGMDGLFPQGVQYPTGSLQQGVYYPKQGVQTLSGPPHGVHLVPGPSQLPVQFTTGVQQQQYAFSSESAVCVRVTSDILNMCIYPSVAVGAGCFIFVTNSGHSVLCTTFRPFRLNNVLITPNIVKNLIFVRQFVRDNSCTVEFDPFGFSVKDFITLLRCASTGDLYLVTKPSTIPYAFLTSQYTWHQ
nr:ribonuclease H-like domain-containing protein [Tanacetum cinerariifolium]